MKTSLHLTDVVVLRHEGDTVNFLGLEITKTRKGFRGEEQYIPCGIRFESVRVTKLGTDSQSWWTLDCDGARVSNSTGWWRLLQLSHSCRKTHLHGTLETRPAILHPTTIHTSPQLHDREQAPNATVETTSQRYATHFVFVLNRAKWFKLVCWNPFVVVTQIGLAFRQQARVLRDIIAMYRT